MLRPKKTYLQNCTGGHLKGGGKSAQQKRTSRIVSRVIFYVLLVAFLGVTGYMLFFSNYLKIGQINIKGVEELDSAQIRSVVEESQQGKFLKTIPRDNFLLISSKNLQQKLLTEFKKIKTVSVIKKFPDTLEINLQERKALLLLCSGEQCFLIDENGIAYSQADFDSPEIAQNHLIKITDNSGGKIEIGSQVMDQAYIQYVSSLKGQLQALGVEIVQEYWTPALVADEIDVRTVETTELYFSTQFPLERATKVLDLVLKKELAKLQLSDLGYLDLRTENKVFYKLKNAAPVENVDTKK